MSKHLRISLAFLVALLFHVSCFRQTEVTVEISVPQMGSPECRSLVLQAIDTLDREAVKRADLDVNRRVARVTYDSTAIALKNIEYAITAAGFDANEERATEEARARLPAACRDERTD
jgi:copper chaperone CopZ